LQIFLLLCVALLFLLGPLRTRLGRGTLQRLINTATVLPVGVVGLAFRRDRRADSLLSGGFGKPEDALRAS
jgi:hypothetical protein